MYIRLKSQLFLRNELGSTKEVFALFRNVVNYARKKYTVEQNDTFLYSFLLLSHKMLIDAESILCLWERGLYGSAIALCEIERRSVRMLGALYLEPSLIKEYLDEEKTSDRDRAFLQKFGETKLQKILDQRFGSSERGPYANLEKAVHASSVGIMIFYGKIRHNPDGSRGGDIVFESFFEKEKGSVLLEVFQGIYLDACGIFLEKYQKEPEVKKIFPKYKKQLGRAVKNMMELD